MFSLIIAGNAQTDAGSGAEGQIITLLQCGWIIGATVNDSSNYEDYISAAAQMAAKTGLTVDWLQTQIQHAADTAYTFAGEEGAAERCVHTLRSAEDLLR
jgi:hypothetical protein